jgi:hypothetical protein
MSATKSKKHVKKSTKPIVSLSAPTFEELQPEVQAVWLVAAKNGGNRSLIKSVAAAIAGTIEKRSPRQQKILSEAAEKCGLDPKTFK